MLRIKGKVDRRSHLRLHEQLGLISLPRQRRRRILRRMGTTAREDFRQNIRQQKTIHGSPMAARQNSRVRRRMLMGLSKKMGVMQRSDTRIDVGWRNGLTAKIARRQQDGIGEVWTASKARKVYGTPDYDAPATRAQAKALIELGYRRRVKKKRGKGVALKRVSQKWIRENITLGQAGVIIRLMRDGEAEGPQRWEVKPEARPFLGVPENKTDEYLNGMARQMVKELR